MVLTPVSEAEVARVLQSLPAKTVTDIKGLSMWLIKLCSTHIVTPLATIINCSFATGVVPSQLKNAKIVPIYKKDDPQLASNYRPISILPCLSKVFEKLFLIRLFDFIEKHNILSDNQFGFRPGKSTIDAVTKLIDTIVEGIENKQQTLSVFIDLSKAFDYVNHANLLIKLESFGVRGVPLEWLRSYLCGRSQCVEVMNSVSETLQVHQGVPQGSILGPVLFLLYVNNISNSISSGNIIQYADDTTLCFKSGKLSDLEIQAFINLNACIQQFEVDSLKTNHSKTNYVKFSLQPRESAPVVTIMVEDSVIEEADSIKFLGIHLDKVLTWKDHIDHVCSKVARGTFALRKLSTYCTPEIQLMAYYGLIHPHLSYGIRLWGSCANTHFDRVFRLQKRAVRTIARLKRRESCKEVFRNLGLLTLPCLYILDTATYCRYKCTLTQGCDIHEYETRTRNVFRIAQHRTAAFENLPVQVGIKLINALPESLKNEGNPKFFKSRLKKILVNFAFYSVGEFLAHHWEY